MTQQKQRIDPTVVAAEAFGEFLEIHLEDLQKLGQIPGFSLIIDAVRKLHLTNKYALGTLDVGARLLVERSALPPALKSLLRNASDGFFDALKQLPENPTDKQVRDALSDGRRKADAAFRKEAAKQRSFEFMVLKLDQTERDDLTGWVNGLSENDRARWTKLKAKIESPEGLKAILQLEKSGAQSAKTIARLGYMDLVYGEKPTPLDTLQAALKGEDTPELRAVTKKVAETKRRLQEKETALKDDSVKIRKRHEPKPRSGNTLWQRAVNWLLNNS